MTIEQLNAADCSGFVAAVGFAFENSPWIAEAAWRRRPFSRVDDLLGAMLAVVAQAPQERRVALIAAHPDLAGRVAREGRLSPSSSQEQSVAGLDHLTPTEIAYLDELNAAYRARFGFPFVICAREHTTPSILASMERRLENDRAAEIVAALAEIGKIAKLRLADLLGE